MHIETVMPATARAASLARAVLDDVTSPALLPRIADAKVVISEIVANAVQYGTEDDGADDVRVVVDSDDERLHVRVEQTLPATPLRRFRSPPTPTGGLGLRIVDALADSWGVEQGPPGCVWFEVEPQPPDASVASSTV